MAKKSKDTDINIQMKKTKKKMVRISIIISIICLGIGGILTYNFLGESFSQKMEVQKELEKSPLKDYPLKDKEQSKLYTRDIQKQTYMLSDGALLFEGTVIFHNKLCANLYSGVTEFKKLKETEPDFSEKAVIGDKILKDAMNSYLQKTPKSSLKTVEDIGSGLIKAINERFIEELGHEVVEDVLITNHIVQ